MTSFDCDVLTVGLAAGLAASGGTRASRPRKRTKEDRRGGD